MTLKLADPKARRGIEAVSISELWTLCIYRRAISSLWAGKGPAYPNLHSYKPSEPGQEEPSLPNKALTAPLGSNGLCDHNNNSKPALYHPKTLQNTLHFRLKDPYALGFHGRYEGSIAECGLAAASRGPGRGRTLRRAGQSWEIR